jgi:hypothetical protein
MRGLYIGKSPLSWGGKYQPMSNRGKKYKKGKLKGGKCKRKRSKGERKRGKGDKKDKCEVNEYK